MSARLLQAQVPAFCLEDCISSEGSIVLDILHESVEKKLCHLLSKAFSSHQSLRLHRGSDFKSVEAGYCGTATDNYYGFLRYASEWLSHRATDKPLYLLVSAILLMMVSCLFLMTTVSCLFKGRSLSQDHHHSESYLDQHWHLDEVLAQGGFALFSTRRVYLCNAYIKDA